MKILPVLLTLPLHAGPYSPEAGAAGSDAVAVNDARIQRWATQVSDYSPGEDLDERWQDATQALGPAGTNVFAITGLGRGGQITLEFNPPISNIPGPDFAIFENGISDFFLELAFVEVSEDGVDFVRIATDSLTASPVGGFGSIDPTDLNGFASKFRAGFGTPFDLAETGVNSARFLRLVDVVGGTSRDSSGDLIYDPFPTTGSAGFDLDGVAVLGELPPEVIWAGVIDEEWVMRWSSEESRNYRVEELDDSGVWARVEEVSSQGVITEFKASLGENPKRIFRVILLAVPPAE